MLIPKVIQVKYYSFLIYLTPPRIFQTVNMWLLLFGMPLRHLNGWIAFIQKLPRDLISSLTIYICIQMN